MKVIYCDDGTWGVFCDDDTPLAWFVKEEYAKQMIGMLDKIEELEKTIKDLEEESFQMSCDCSEMNE